MNGPRLLRMLDLLVERGVLAEADARKVRGLAERASERRLGQLDLCVCRLAGGTVLLLVHDNQPSAVFTVPASLRAHLKSYTLRRLLYEPGLLDHLADDLGISTTGATR